MVAFPKGTQAVYKRSGDKLLAINRVSHRERWLQLTLVKRQRAWALSGFHGLICALFLNKRPKERGKRISLYSKMWLFLDSSRVRT